MGRYTILAHEKMLREMTYDDIHEIELPGHDYKSHTCGYVTPGGTILKCEPYHHIDLLTSLVYGTYKDWWKDFQRLCDELDVMSCDIVSIYETFFMIKLEWVKIEAYIQPGQGSMMPEDFKYDWKVEWIYPLTPEQTRVIYPK